jgi:hypothetical protein
MKLNMKKYYNLVLIVLSIFCFKAMTAQTYCVGEHEKITWHYFKNNATATFEEMLVNPNFPNSPDAVKKVFSTKAPAFYDNDFSGRIQGFIRVPTTTTATFNITSQSKGRFYLSTDQTPSNKILLAFNEVSVDELEHNNAPSQTSQPVVLVANTYYYFDVQYVAGGWADQANLFWKTNLVNETNWNVITSNFLYDIACASSCPPIGSPCNDNNSATTNDIEDGNCNCYGKPASTHSCIGDRGILENYTYYNIPGYSINSLEINPKFPTKPDTKTNLSTINMTYVNRDSLGHFLQGFINVPVTGLYKFNITGDDQTVFRLSSNDSISNKNWQSISVPGWATTAEHNKYPEQTSGNIQLIAGKYYYFEILCKDSWGGDHFDLYWQAPFTPVNVWKKIPAVYTYDYTCELACLTPGTPCDDGNIFTNNDVINANCACVGTPCSGPNCNSPIANYKPYDKCNVSEQLDNNISNNWISCVASPSPNSIRGNSHWLRYDLGKRHKLLSTHLWNYNVFNETQKGFESTAIDYSLDGVNWITLDTFSLSQATGNSGYGGEAGPDVEGIYARYVLFTSMDGSTECRGMSKVVFQAIVCPPVNTPCDDGNRLKLNDRYNNNCECIGMDIEINPCTVQSLFLGDSILPSLVFGASLNLQSISTIQSPNPVGFLAGKAIELLPGFKTMPNSVFVATIDDCIVLAAPPSEYARVFSKARNREKVSVSKLDVDDLLIDGDKNIKFFVDQPGQVKLELLNLKGEWLSTIIDCNYPNNGYFEKALRMQKLNEPHYIIQYTTSQGTIIRKEF